MEFVTGIPLQSLLAWLFSGLGTRRPGARQAVALIASCLLLGCGRANSQGVSESHALDVTWPARHSDRQQISGVAPPNPRPARRPVRG